MTDEQIDNLFHKVTGIENFLMFLFLFQCALSGVIIGLVIGQ
jgi:hypothetical protein